MDPNLIPTIIAATIFIGAVIAIVVVAAKSKGKPKPQPKTKPKPISDETAQSIGHVALGLCLIGLFLWFGGYDWLFKSDAPARQHEAAQDDYEWHPEIIKLRELIAHSKSEIKRCEGHIDVQQEHLRNIERFESSIRQIKRDLKAISEMEP